MRNRQGLSLTILGMLVAFLVVFPSSAPLAAAGSYPSKPVQIIVPAPPGGALDIGARIVAQKLNETLGQPVLVDNRPGASHMIAAAFVSKSAPDGHTLLLGSQTALAVVPILYPKAGVDPVKDFSAAAMIGNVPLILVINPSVPAKSVRELIAYAKSKPGELNFGSGGVGTTPHMAGELFATTAGITLVHVGYKGEAPALTDLIGGHLTMMFSNVSAAMPHVKAGKLRGLAVTSPDRQAAAPGIPTVAESGLPGYEVQTWLGLVAPAGTPREILARLNAEVAKAVARPDVKQRFADQGMTAAGGTPEQFGDYIKSENVKWAKVIKEADIKPE
jgi:tripartite-type tricarboxylate transporter receptor subunit TctC